MKKLAVTQVPITSVRRLEKNPRQHSERQITEMVRSLEAFGQYRPLVVDEDGNILAGNGLHLALERAGHEEISVTRMVGLSEDQKTKLVLADNRIGDLSGDNYEVMEEMLRSLGDFEVPGFDPDALRELMADVEETVEYAEEFGKLTPEIIHRMEENTPVMQEGHEGARVGSLPPPMAGDGQGGSGSDACPTCGKPW